MYLLRPVSGGVKAYVTLRNVTRTPIRDRYMYLRVFVESPPHEAVDEHVTFVMWHEEIVLVYLIPSANQGFWNSREMGK